MEGEGLQWRMKDCNGGEEVVMEWLELWREKVVMCVFYTC